MNDEIVIFLKVFHIIVTVADMSFRMASLHHTTFSSVVSRLCYSNHSSLIDIHSSYKQVIPNLQKARIPAYLLVVPTTVQYVSSGSGTVAIAPPPVSSP